MRACAQTWENPEEVDPDAGFKGDNDPLDAVEARSGPMMGSPRFARPSRRLLCVGYHAGGGQRTPLRDCPPRPPPAMRQHWRPLPRLTPAAAVSQSPLSFLPPPPGDTDKRLISQKITLSLSLQVGFRQMRCGEVSAVKVLGVLAMIDDGETDWKVLCLRVDDPLAASVRGNRRKRKSNVRPRTPFACAPPPRGRPLSPAPALPLPL